MLLAIGDALFDRADHITGFADTDADLPFLVADNDDGAEAHLLAALHGLGDATDLDHAFLPFRIAFLVATAATAVTTPAAVAASATTTAFALALPLPFSSGWYISGAGNVLALGLVGCFSHGCSGSELQARFPGSVGQGLDPTVVQVASAVEDHLLDAFGDGALSDEFADRHGGVAVGTV